VSPEESQFLATQKQGLNDIARIFGVPPQKIASEVGGSMTYQTVEMAGIDFLTYSIQWWLSLLEAALYPLQPGQKHFRFDSSVLLRTDYETTMKATTIGIASKQMTPDEARAKRDEPPLTDEQKAILALVPMEASATGLPKLLPAVGQPATTEGEPA
jgi:HK97 family phage portal protein